MVWRKTVLHYHTTPNERSADSFDPEAVIARVNSEGIQVLAITDHNSAIHVADLRAASSGTQVEIVAGVEVDTDRGHLVLLAPGNDGDVVLGELIARAGIQPDTERRFEDITAIARRDNWSGGAYRDRVVMIGAHVDQEGSLLQSHQTLSVERQVEQAMGLDAVEVVSDGARTQYVASGLKNLGRKKAIIRASDVHLEADNLYPTWIYLPTISATAMRHAFCIPEAAIRFDEIHIGPQFTIDTVSFDGGMHQGKTFVFDERATALIGAPSTGKSLIVDAVRFAFGQESPIEEIRDLSRSRLDRSLGQGTTVTVTGMAQGVEYHIARTWGGAQEVVPPFKPIVFGQTELVRRAMERHPSMDLLDIHSGDADSLKVRAGVIVADLKALLADALQLAAHARSVAARVENPEDGLEATRRKLRELSGNETLARKALEVGRLRTWRQSALSAIDEWIATFVGVPGPDLPTPPSTDSSVLDTAPFLPLDAIAAERQSSVAQSLDAAKATADRLRLLVLQNDAGLTSLEAEVGRELAAAGFEEGSELLAQMEGLRSRLESLEDDALELSRNDEALKEATHHLGDLVVDAENVRSLLRTARSETSTGVNESMRTFRARLNHDINSEHVDGLLEQAKTGTYQRRTALGAVRDALDRARLLEVALVHAAGRDAIFPPKDGMDQQDDIARTAIDRGQSDALAELAGSWPGDGLLIEARDGSGSYEQLTEGMRALAIKEISFASSSLPVVTDQPEDAVPPQNVFQDLVPTIRKQRVYRQFILASHDANIVVAGDVERVIVMSGTSEADANGSLYDPGIRLAAIELLEGGHEAFELRKERYGE